MDIIKFPLEDARPSCEGYEVIDLTDVDHDLLEAVMLGKMTDEEAWLENRIRRGVEVS